MLSTVYEGWELYIPQIKFLSLFLNVYYFLIIPSKKQCPLTPIELFFTMTIPYLPFVSGINMPPAGKQ